MLLTGPEGSGKSMLLFEMAQRQMLAGGSVLRVSCALLDEPGAAARAVSRGVTMNNRAFPGRRPRRSGARGPRGLDRFGRPSGMSALRTLVGRDRRCRTNGHSVRNVDPKTPPASVESPHQSILALPTPTLESTWNCFQPRE